MKVQEKKCCLSSHSLVFSLPFVLYPKGPDCARIGIVTHHGVSSFGIFKGKPKYEVTRVFLPEKPKWVKSQAWYKDKNARILRDGSLGLHFLAADYSKINLEMLKHNDKVEVAKPNSLRD